MAVTTIHLKTDAAVRDKAAKVAHEFGISLTTLLNQVLDQVASTKKVRLDLEEIPSKWMIEQMRKSEEDVKAGRVLSFETPSEAVKYFRELAESDETVDRAHH